MWNNGQRFPFFLPQSPDFARLDVPTLRKRNLDLPWPLLPEKMFVVIDGWPATYKAAAARWVAKALGALFIDCRSLPLYLARDYLDLLDFDDLWGLETWIATVKVEVGFELRNGILEGRFGINGKWYEWKDVAGLEAESQKLLSLPSVRESYAVVLSRFNFEDRVVLLGDDVLCDFYNSPFRFFIDSFKRKNPSEKNWYSFGLTGKRKAYEESAAFYNHGVNAICIDGHRADLGDAVMMVLVECVGRAHEMGVLPVTLEEGFLEAADLGDALRNQINRVRGHPLI